MPAQRKRLQFQDLYEEVFTYSGTLDVASLNDAAGATSTLTVPGVALGDHVLSFAHGVDLAGITVTAYVSAANTVAVRFQNESAGTVDLASTTIRVVVGRPNLAHFV